MGENAGGQKIWVGREVAVIMMAAEATTAAEAEETSGQRRGSCRESRLAEETG